MTMNAFVANSTVCLCVHACVCVCDHSIANCDIDKVRKILFKITKLFWVQVVNDFIICLGIPHTLLDRN